MSGPRSWRPRGLATRLLVGQTLVLVAGALTVALIAGVVGPPIFHDHLVQTGHPPDSPELAHIELAYRDASLLSLGLGLVISLAAAWAVTWVLARFLRRPLTRLTQAARELARGHYGARVPVAGDGTELDTLASAFNLMADRVQGVEDTRRRLLTDLAHELRTPIATLAAYHEGLGDGVIDLGPETRAVLTEQTARLTRLAEDIEEVSRAEEGRLALHRRPVAVAELVGTAADALREPFAGHGVTLTVRRSRALDTLVEVDRTRVGQVLTNLLSNALRHTPAGGTVTVGARREGGEVVLRVTDDGEGIPADQLPHVFERFFRGDGARSRDRSGSGIGLTISRAIVDAHGGSITAASAGPGRGATFSVTLPVAPREHRAAAHTQPG